MIRRRDLVEHFENRLEAMDGKAMVVCMSRESCAAPLQRDLTLRPEWHQTLTTRGSSDRDRPAGFRTAQLATTRKK